MPTARLRLKKREQPERKLPVVDRMVRRLKSKRVCACAPFREECWPAQSYPQRKD